MGSIFNKPPREEVYAEAEKRFRELILKEPDNLDAKFNLGVTLYNLNRFDEAKEIFLMLSSKNTNKNKDFDKDNASCNAQVIFQDDKKNNSFKHVHVSILEEDLNQNLSKEKMSPKKMTEYRL